MMTCYWVMPYKDKCEISLENLRTEVVSTSLTVYSSDWEWNERTMYFGVGWMEYHRKYTGLHKSINGTLDAEDINFVTLTGQGVYVGDAITIFNTVGDWWGEGMKRYILMEKVSRHILGPGRRIITVMLGVCQISLNILLLPNPMAQELISLDTWQI